MLFGIPYSALDGPHGTRELEGRDRALITLVEPTHRRVVELVLVAAIQPLVDRHLFAPAGLLEGATPRILSRLALQPLAVKVVDEVSAGPDHPRGRVLDPIVGSREIAGQRLRGDILGGVARSLCHLPKLSVVGDGPFDLSAQRDEITTVLAESPHPTIAACSPRGFH